MDHSRSLFSRLEASKTAAAKLAHSNRNGRHTRVLFSPRFPCGVSSAVEHLAYTEGVGGSNPSPRTN